MANDALSPSQSKKRVVEVAGEELDALLAPLGVDAFVNDYWGKKPLFLKGHPDKYKGLFDRNALAQALSAVGAFPKDSLHVSFDKKAGVQVMGLGGGRTDAPTEVVSVSSEQVGALFGAGATLCITELELRVPKLSRFIGNVKRRLSYPGKVSFNSYLSPPGSGFNWHFDARIASSMQIEGSKWWRYSNEPPRIRWPRSNGMLRPDGYGRFSNPMVGHDEWEKLPKFDDSDLTEVLLEPGDLLVLPAGTWHDARASEGLSLALNLAFNPISYSDIVRELLDSMLVSDADWRSARPLLRSDDSFAIKSEHLAVIAKELENAGAKLRDLRPDSAELARVWTTLVQSADTNHVDATRRLNARDARPLAPEDTLRPVAGSGAYLHELAGEKLLLAIGSARIELGGVAAVVARRAMRAPRFVASETVTWAPGLTWELVLPLLTTLVRDGILERAPCPNVPPKDHTDKSP